jgi:hypothetical protein
MKDSIFALLDYLAQWGAAYLTPSRRKEIGTALRTAASGGTCREIGR